MTRNKQRVGLIGAGFISDYHVDAVKLDSAADLAAVCDLNEAAAKRIAAMSPGCTTWTDLGAMLREAELDVVHVLTQPDSHAALATQALDAGCDVILEKPVTSSTSEAKALLQHASSTGRRVAINHNFVFSRPFQRLKDCIATGTLGPIKSVRILWKKFLAPIDRGPWDLWMIREPHHVLFETGSHSVSELLAVIDPPERFEVQAMLPKVLPAGQTVNRRWVVRGRSGTAHVQMEASFDQGYDQHSVEVEGLFGVARADIENDVFHLDAPTGRSYDLERLSVNFRQGLSRARQAFSTYRSYAFSKFVKRVSGAPYRHSMLEGIQACYRHIRNEPDAPREVSLDFAVEVTETCQAIASQTPTSERLATEIPAATKEAGDVDALVIGATGFIGKQLLKELLQKGLRVRALVRNPSGLAGQSLPAECEVVVGDFRNQDVIERAVRGAKVVYHLAVAHGSSLDEYLSSNLEPTKRLVAACKDAGITRLVYTGTIDSLYLGPGAGAVTESDGRDKSITRRNNYARCKAMVEEYLEGEHRESGFPVVIARPAIVVGVGGPVDHVGVAEWFGIGQCLFWGRGDHPVPLVLVDDVARGLAACADTDGIDGRCYNLSAPSSVSARDYVEAVQEILGSRIRSKSGSLAKRFTGDLFKWSMKILARHPDRRRIPSVRDWRCREQHASFDTSAAARDLGWKAEGDREQLLERGIREPTRRLLTDAGLYHS